MLDYAKEIVYSEGHAAYKNLFTPMDNPYEGVSDTFQRIWYDAWWDAFYEDQ